MATAQRLSDFDLPRLSSIGIATTEESSTHPPTAMSPQCSAAELDLVPAHTQPVGGVAKRTTDVLIAATALLALSPLLCLLFVLVAWHSRGNPLFSHARLGFNGRKFGCLKFRTMCRDANELLAQHLRINSAAAAEWAASHKLRNDPRVTTLGHVLRASSLDELPQLLNVLSGSMSIVGPRPIVFDEVSRYGSGYHFYSACRPGITGLWQISGRSDCGYEERTRLDQTYAQTWSYYRDLNIILKTFRVVASRRGSY